MKTQFTFFCLVFALCINILITTKAQVNKKDSLALVDLYNSTNGAEWDNQGNWLAAEPVNKWYGVYLTTNGKRVSEIDLRSNNLNGHLPSSLGNLSYLSGLWLNGNQLSGKIPPELGKLTSLTILNLMRNQLSGKIPPELGKLTSLTELLINSNKLSGKIPPELGELSKLSSLNLTGNQLTGRIPGKIGNLKNLKHLSLQQNQLSGALPSSIAGLTSLEILNLSRNQFTFDGMELIAETFSFAKYISQANIPVHLNNNALSVSAGGSLTNNTYTWIKVGRVEIITIEGDSVFHPTESGIYYVRVSNKIATGVDLISDTIHYISPAASLNAVSFNSKPPISNNSFSVYPNPAKDVLYVRTKGNVAFSLLNQTGELILTQNINNTASINVSGIATGIYYLRNNNTNGVEKIVIVK